MSRPSDPGFKLALDKIIERVRAGSDFSTALSEHPKLFTKIYVNMIKAGEASGQLDVILQRLADYMESVEELKREIKAAMTYPVISLVLILSITVGLVVGIVPKFKTIFDQLGMTELPPPTKILLQLSDALRNQYIAVGLGTISVVVGFLLYIRTKPGMRQWHWFLLHAPVFGPLFRKVADLALLAHLRHAHPVGRPDAGRARHRRGHRRQRPRRRGRAQGQGRGRQGRNARRPADRRPACSRRW
jgi:type IV pilus assembly protein PilC